jgi:hypothetical protein
MKTPVRQEVLRTLEQLNDQLRFFTFAEHEMLDRLRDFSPAIQVNFTSDLFARNPYASRIHVRLARLPAFQEANRSFTFGSYVSTSYEVAATFFGRAITLAAECGVAIKAAGERAPEVKFAQNVVAAGWTPPDDGVVDLMTFIRHRRNAFVHLHTLPNRPYAEFCQRAGMKLNQRWQAARDVIDFTVPTIGGFAEPEAVACLKLLRIAVKAFDQYVSGAFGESVIVTYLAKRTYAKENVRMTEDLARRRRRKIASLATQEFGLNASPGVVDAAVRAIGIS